MNTFGIYFKRNKKAFTIIELIVVIAVIGILVLLAAPKFLNYTKKAQLARIQNDTKAASTVVDAELTVSDSLAKWGEPVDIDLETLKNEKKIYTIEGLLTEENIESGPYWKIDKSDFRSKLPGEFYANSGGMVYYVDTKSGSVESNGGNQDAGNDGGGTTPTPEPTIAPGEINNTESTVKGPNGEEVPPGYTLLTDADFEFIEDVYAANSYSINGGASTKGFFHYKGTTDKVVIPNKIMGNDIKDYYQMFYYNGDSSRKVGAKAGDNGTAVIAVASNNPNVTSMYGMFRYSEATSLDLSSFDTSKVTTMSSMFANSQATSIVGLDKFNTSNVTNMSFMFRMSRATSLDLSSFDTSNVTDVTDTTGMFDGSQAIEGFARTQADADKFNASYYKPAGLTFVVKESEPEETSKYTLATDDDFSGTTDGTFKYIGTDEYVEVPHTIKGVAVTSYGSMFAGTSVKGVKSTNTNVTTTFYMFFSSKATSLDLSNFNTSNVTTMESMFYNSQATSLDLSSFDTSNVTSMKDMFYNSQATSIVGLDKFNTTNVTNMNWMFRDSKATSLDLRSFNTANVTTMSRMFEGSQATSIVGLDKFNTTNVTNMYTMFANSQATELDLSSFDTSNVTKMEEMFKESQAITGFARTQTDAAKFNATANKPKGLTFIVK